MRISRRTFLLLSAAIGAAAPGYGKLLESSWLEVTRTRIPIRGIRRPVRILHLSDLHAGADTPFEVTEQAIALGLAENPDLVCLTGDYISRGQLPDLERYRAVLRPLAGATPAVASFGNHDGGRWAAQEGGVAEIAPLRAMFESAGVRCLVNESTIVEAADQPLSLVGIGDLWARQNDPQAGFSGNSGGSAPTVVLSHNPDTVRSLESYRWDLLLAGHTHGGQVVVPVVGLAPFAPVHDRRFIAGLCSLGDRHVFVTRGVGSILGIRFACRPEVSILDVTPA